MPARRARERVPVGLSGVRLSGRGYRRGGLLSVILREAKNVALDLMSLLIIGLTVAVALGAIGLAATTIWAMR